MSIRQSATTWFCYFTASGFPELSKQNGYPTGPTDSQHDPALIFLLCSNTHYASKELHLSSTIHKALGLVHRSGKDCKRSQWKCCISPLNAPQQAR